jgi:hypothetical protein
MRKSALLLVVLAALLSVNLACSSGDIKAGLGEEISLAISQKVLITGENLEIRFKEITEDSRCARDVVCIWEGRVVNLLEIIKDGVSQEITMTQPGLTDHPSQESFQGYIFTFNIEPYPQKAEEPIKDSEYRLILTVSQN